MPGGYAERGYEFRYRTFTPGVYVIAENGGTAGVFSNSYGRVSPYAGWTFETDDRRFALTFAVAGNYPQRPLQPIVLPSIRFEIARNTAVRIGVIPGQNKPHASTVVHVALEREL